MVISKGLLVLGMVFGMAAGGVVDRVVDVCKTCRKEADLVGIPVCARGPARAPRRQRVSRGHCECRAKHPRDRVPGHCRSRHLGKNHPGVWWCRRSDGCTNQRRMCKFIYLFIYSSILLYFYFTLLITLLLLYFTHYFTKFV